MPAHRRTPNRWPDASLPQSWLFDRRSLAQITSGPHHQLRMLNVRGDSMQAVLDDGDVILVNTDDLLPSPPGIFVLFDGMGVMAKRAY